MTKEEIDKWLDEEYGCSYTRLEELHDYYFEKYTEQKEEIDRLNNIIDELEKYLKENSKQSEIFECDRYYKSILDKLKELKEGKEWKRK